MTFSLCWNYPSKWSTNKLTKKWKREVCKFFQHLSHSLTLSLSLSLTVSYSLSHSLSVSPALSLFLSVSPSRTLSYPNSLLCLSTTSLSRFPFPLSLSFSYSITLSYMLNCWVLFSFFHPRNFSLSVLSFTLSFYICLSLSSPLSFFSLSLCLFSSISFYSFPEAQDTNSYNYISSNEGQLHWNV